MECEGFCASCKYDRCPGDGAVNECAYCHELVEECEIEEYEVSGTKKWVCDACVKRGAFNDVFDDDEPKDEASDARPAA